VNSGESAHTHTDGIDLADDPDSRIGTTENVNSILQTSLINNDISIPILVFLLISPALSRPRK
jgi:hypothetical protein